MKTRKSLFGIVLLSVALAGSVAFATSPLGSPVPSFGEGTFYIGVDYFTGDVAIELVDGLDNFGGFWPGGPHDDFEVETWTLTAGYVILPWLAVEGSVGVSKGSWDETDNVFDGDDDWYAGGGVRAKFFDGETFDWGGSVLAHWFQTDGENSGVNGAPWMGDTEVDFVLVRGVLGGAADVNDCLKVYYGVFGICLDGTKYYQEPGWWEEYDVEAQTDFGGLFGVMLRVWDGVWVRGEVQITDEDEAVGFSLIMPFGGEE